MFNCGNCELVVGKQTIITHSLQLSDIVKNQFGPCAKPQGCYLQYQLMSVI